MDEFDNIENRINDGGDSEETENIFIIDDQSLLDLKDRQLLDNALYKILHISPFGAVLEFNLKKSDQLLVNFSIKSLHLNYVEIFKGETVDEILEEIEFKFSKVLKKWKADRF